jgi:hypothetical protein
MFLAVTAHTHGVAASREYWITGSVKSISTARAVILLDTAQGGAATATLMFGAIDSTTKETMKKTLMIA